MNKIEKRNVMLYSMGKLVSLMGTNIYNFAMGLYILKITGSGMSFALSMFCTYLPRVILGTFAGGISDIIDRKKLVLLTDFLSGVVMIFMFLIVKGFGINLIIIYLSMIILSSLNTFFDVAFGAATPSLVRRNHLQKLQSYGELVGNMSRIMGPMLGGVVYAFISLEMFILLNGISFIISAISEGFINFDWQGNLSVDEKDRLNVKKILQNIKEGYKYIITKKDMKLLITFLIFVNFFLSAVMVVGPMVFVNNLKMTGKEYGLVSSAASVGAVIFSVILSRKKGNTNTTFEFNKFFKKQLMLSLVIILMGLPVIPLEVSILKQYILVYYIGMYMIFGALILCINIPISVYIKLNTSDEYRGRVGGFMSTFVMGITPLGYLIHGKMVEMIPSYCMFLYVGISILILCYVVVRNGSNITRIKTRKCSIP